jgi:hypothetical protein
LNRERLEDELAFIDEVLKTHSPKFEQFCKFYVDRDKYLVQKLMEYVLPYEAGLIEIRDSLVHELEISKRKPFWRFIF